MPSSNETKVRPGEFIWRLFYFMKNENYITIQGWMINELGLNSNELIVYSIIYGFCQDGQSEFTGSLKYLENSVNCSRPTIIKIINELIEKNLISKKQELINGVVFNRYKVILPVVNKFNIGSKETSLGGSKETLHNNTTNNNSNYNIKKNISKDISKKGFDLISEIEKFEYSPQRKEKIKEWIMYKEDEKKKRYKQLGFKAFLTQNHKYSDNEFCEMVDRSMANGWDGLFENKQKNNDNFGNHFGVNNSQQPGRLTQMMINANKALEILNNEDYDTTNFD